MLLTYQSPNMCVTLVKELASRRSAREPRGGAADVPQRLSTLLGSTHTDMKRARGPMAVHEQQRKRRRMIYIVQYVPI